MELVWGVFFFWGGRGALKGFIPKSPDWRHSCFCEVYSLHTFAHGVVFTGTRVVHIVIFFVNGKKRYFGVRNRALLE